MPIALLVSKDEGDFRSGRGRLALTTAQAAAHVGVHAKTFEGFVESGMIEPWPEMRGNYRLYLQEDVETLRQERATKKQRRF